MVSFKVIKREIKLEKEVTKLDKFVIELIDIIKKFCFLEVCKARKVSTESNPGC